MANCIRVARESIGIRQVDLAEKLGITQATLSNWERGEYEPDNTSLVKLSGILGVTVDYLLTGKKPDIKKAPRYIVEGESVFEQRIGFYGETKKYLTEDDLDDIAAVMRAKAERNKQRAASADDNTGKDK